MGFDLVNSLSLPFYLLYNYIDHSLENMFFLYKLYGQNCYTRMRAVYLRGPITKNSEHSYHLEGNINPHNII